MSEREQGRNQEAGDVSGAHPTGFLGLVRAAAQRQATAEVAAAQAASDQQGKVKDKARRLAVEAERNRKFTGTEPAEVLGEAGAQLCAEFLRFMADKQPAGREMRLGKPRGIFSQPSDGAATVRAHRIGYVGAIKAPPHTMYQLYLCSDNKLRVYNVNASDGQTIANVPIEGQPDGVAYMPARIGYYDPKSEYYVPPPADSSRGAKPSGPYYHYIAQTLEERLADLAAAAERGRRFPELVGEGPLSGYDAAPARKAMAQN